MNTNYLAVVSCLHCGEMIITKPDGSIFCACTTKRPCKHPEGMGDCHECTIARLQEQVEEAERCGECASSPEEIRLPAMYRCYYCDKQFCGPHAKDHFTKDGSTAAALTKAEALAERRKEVLELIVRAPGQAKALARTAIEEER